ncbi:MULTISPECIES: hypothetical protein [unclassified Paenibacillus]|uniref:hypothetical protein n=1 Tax=unclassified Paenibacillus TaxID=185978 RepID=UPI00363C73A0
MNKASIPRSDEKLTIELTVKEAMALGSGVNFWGDPLLAAQARKKVRASLEQLLIPGNHRLYYEAIDL